MFEGLPGFDFVFERIYEVLLGQGLVSAEIDLPDQVLLGNHFARDYIIIFAVHRQICACEAALAQQFVFYLVFTVNHLYCL